MRRREFCRGLALAAAAGTAGRAAAWMFVEKGRMPAGVDPRPLNVIQLPLDDPRRRQNQFLPALPPDANRFTFGSDGTFTFFHVSDLHERRAAMGARERDLFARLCDRYAPSLVLMTGDNVDLRCRGLFEETAGAVVKLFADARLPFAVTFGNHDTESVGEGWYTAAEQWTIFRRLGGRLFVDRHDPAVIGGGASRIPILGADGRVRFDLCLLDSGDYGRQGFPLSAQPHFDERLARTCFDSVRAPQVKWAAQTLAGGVPTLFFQHIIVPEAQMKKKAGLFTVKAGGFGEGFGSVPPSMAREAVYLHEGRSLYDVWRAAANFRGAYFGHDHKNSFDGVTDDGVRLGMTKTLGSCAYNDGDLALRMFRLHADGSYETDILSERHPDGTRRVG